MKVTIEIFPLHHQARLTRNQSFFLQISDLFENNLPDELSIHQLPFDNNNHSLNKIK